MSTTLKPFEENGKFGYKSEGATIPEIHAHFEEAHPFVDGIARVKKGDGYGYMNTEGRFPLHPSFKTATDFDHNGRAIAVRDGREWHLRLKDGAIRTLIPQEVEEGA